MHDRQALPGYGSHRRESFARYYLRNVAVNEGCGCAEGLLLRDRGLAQADPAASGEDRPKPGLLARIATLFGAICPAREDRA